ncbi:hypothetical protein [Paraferrimonas sedimenticola]|uniref:DUF1304 domain-containing protein n=1 Tax=Paraferrimonas sedimenticola TaxID=375674 RepID=A0AA37RWJ7_9GAMM|nr:hypothetical protein [Paraferrimonas sedimenticola]GLP96438.1 hypothetical protein GCM10007895_17440 [Paraferrimonas sedimenticola]
MSGALMIGALAALLTLIWHLIGYKALLGEDGAYQQLPNHQQLALRGWYHGLTGFHVVVAITLGATATEYVAISQVYGLVVFLAIIYGLQCIWYAYSVFCYRQGGRFYATMAGIGPFVATLALLSASVMY